MRRRRWALVAAAAAVVGLVVPAVGQGKVQGGSLRWSLSRAGPTATSYDFGTVDLGSGVTRAFRLGSSSSTKSGALAISLSGSSAFWIDSDLCTTKSIGRKLSCWVRITYGPLGGASSESATLTAKGEHGPAAILSLFGSGNGPSPPPVSWGSALEVPGTAALNVGGDAGVNTVSCASAGECAAGGFYGDGSGTDGRGSQAFVVSETRGVWGTAIEVPGTASLNVGGHAAVTSISCSSAGGCAASGTYTDSHSNPQAFLVSEKGGVWDSAIEVPGLAALGGGGGSSVVGSVSCPSPGNCAAGGWSGGKAFVVSENNGTWGTALDVGDGGVSSVSCGGVGDCVAAGGIYVAVERNGVWGQQMKLPGIGAFGLAWVTSVSCPSPRNCAVIGQFEGDHYISVFVAEEKDGTWGRARAVSFAGNSVSAPSVSCGGPGNCVFGGLEGDFDKYGDGFSDAYLVSERIGKWGYPFPVGLEYDGYPAGKTESVSCASAGNCVATGWYTAVPRVRAFVVAERTGVWGAAEDVPGTATLGTDSYVAAKSVSCAHDGSCAIGGFYDDASGVHAFVTAP